MLSLTYASVSCIWSSCASLLGTQSSRFVANANSIVALTAFWLGFHFGSSGHLALYLYIHLARLSDQICIVRLTASRICNWLGGRLLLSVPLRLGHCEPSINARALRQGFHGGRDEFRRF